MAALGATPLTLQPERLESRLHTPPRPNIVLILADDFPRAALHAYGLPRRFDVAPNLMSLYHSSNGVAMSEGYTTSSLCTPSRLAFMTGRYASENLLDAQPFRCCTRDLREQATLHRVLKGAGFFTGYFGKFHMVDDEPGVDPLNTLRMFGHKLPSACDGDLEDRFRMDCVNSVVKQLIGADQVESVYLDNEVLDERYHHPEEEAEKAVQFVRTAPMPFFLHMNPTLTHEPKDYTAALFEEPTSIQWGPRKAIRGSVMRGKPMDPQWLQSRLDARRLLRQRLRLQQGKSGKVARCSREDHPCLEQESLRWPATIAAEIASNNAWPADLLWQSGLGSYSHMEILAGAAWLDATLGRVFAEVRNRSGNNTLTIFTADHGNCKTGKGAPYSGGARVPLLLHWPMYAPPDSRLRMRHIDWLPTLASLAGASVPEGLSGVDRAAALWPSAFPFSPEKDDEAAFEGKHPLILENGFSRAVVSGQWKLVLNLLSPSEQATAQKAASKAQLEASKGCFSFYGQMVGVNQLTYAGPALYPHYCDSTQLYDLRHDPSEQRNVYLDHPRTAERLTKVLWDRGCGTAQSSCRWLKQHLTQRSPNSSRIAATPTPGIPTHLTLTQL